MGSYKIQETENALIIELLDPTLPQFDMVVKMSAPYTFKNNVITYPLNGSSCWKDGQKFQIGQIYKKVFGYWPDIESYHLTMKRDIHGSR